MAYEDGHLLLLQVINYTCMYIHNSHDLIIHQKNLNTLFQAANPLSPEVLEKLGLEKGKVRTAAVCVYPSRVADAHDVIKRMDLVKEIQIASG